MQSLIAKFSCEKTTSEEKRNDFVINGFVIYVARYNKLCLALWIFYSLSI